MTVSRSEPLGEHRTMHGRVVDWIGMRIVSGDFTDGTQLPNEADLSNQLAVSRGGIREAIKALAAKGLVEPRPRLGTRVQPKQLWNLMDREVIEWHGRAADTDFLNDLLELRLMVEPGAARLAAERATDAQIDTLGIAYQGMATHAKTLDTSKEAFVRADLDFHLTILRAGGNQLMEQLGRLIGLGLHHVLDATSDLPGGVRTVLPLHHALLVAVRARRPIAAERAARKMLETTVQLVLGYSEPE